MSKSTRAQRFSSDKISLLLTALENSPDLVSGELGRTYKTLNDVKNAWEGIASLLSSCGLATRSGTDVKNKWIDLKCKTKRKAAELENEFNGTGGGRNKGIFLTPTEERVIALCGRTAVNGILPVGADLTAHQILPPQNIQLSSEIIADEFVDMNDDDICAISINSTTGECDLSLPSSSQSRPTEVFSSTPVNKKRKSSSAHRVKKLREKRKQADLKENEEITKNVITTQNEMKGLLQEINNQLQSNKQNQNDLLKEVKDLNSSVKTLSNNIVIFTSVIANAVGVNVQNCT